jgi:hypothetical protein
MSSNIIQAETESFRNHSIQIVELFLAHGADPNSIATAGYVATSTIWAFALENAASNNQLMKQLLLHGADPFLPTIDTVRLAPEIMELVRQKRKTKKKIDIRRGTTAREQRTSGLSKFFSSLF